MSYRPNPTMIAAGAALSAWADPPLVAREVRYLTHWNPELDPHAAAGVVVRVRQINAVIAAPLWFIHMFGINVFFGGLGMGLPAYARWVTGEGSFPSVFLAPLALAVVGFLMFWLPGGLARLPWWIAARYCGAYYESVMSPWGWVFRRRPEQFKPPGTPEQRAAVRLRIRVLVAFITPFYLLMGLGVIFWFGEMIEEARRILGI